jgi:hypothetical protein
VATDEVQGFKDAFSRLAEKEASDFKPPTMTIIVCQRQSNYRIFPECIQGKYASEQNVSLWDI